MVRIDRNKNGFPARNQQQKSRTCTYIDNYHKPTLDGIQESRKAAQAPYLSQGKRRTSMVDQLAMMSHGDDHDITPGPLDQTAQSISIGVPGVDRRDDLEWWVKPTYVGRVGMGGEHRRQQGEILEKSFEEDHHSL
ncbi:hypothetical protein NEUTE2DRAFT_67878 [Neurospora tetrasperma FGSC 2509]|nr:hypothetical protein NEUTE2DRAFT_67878 [Neurospora tetrasperma FGSC 2509]